MSEQANEEMAFLKKAVLWTKGNGIKDFENGKVFNHHWGRTLSNGDNSLFTSLTQMYNPTYFNSEYAKENGHPGCVVAPLLVFNTVLGISVEDLSLRGIFVSIVDCIFHKDVYEGDTLTCRSTVVNKRFSESRKGAAVVTWKTEGFNQDGDLVIEFVRSNLLLQ